MIDNVKLFEVRTKPAGSGSQPALPAGAEIQQVAFVPTGTTEQSDRELVLFQFPPLMKRRAVLVTRSPDPNQALPAADLQILSVPLPSFAADDPAATSGEGDALLAQLRGWVETSTAADQPASHLMMLQGAQILWNKGRIAILAAADRLATIRTALIETAFYEGELQDIERILGTAWPQMETDAPLAFDFDERAAPRRKVLLQRFQQVLLLRGRLARMAPQVHCPHVHPPTLASQVGERFRERTRLAHRHELLGEQLEVFEKIYEMCGQRASDFVLNRSGNMLEWVIILLLVAQLLLSTFELLANQPQTSDTPTSETQTSETDESPNLTSNAPSKTTPTRKVGSGKGRARKAQTKSSASP